MSKQTATEKTVARLRARRARLANELATVDRMLAAADGKSVTTIAVGPFVPAQPAPSTPLPFYPFVQPLTPYQPPVLPWDFRPGVILGYPAFPFGEVICGGTLPVSMGGMSLTATTRIDACGGIHLMGSPLGVFTHNAPVTIATGSH